MAAVELIEKLRARKMRVTTAESCTGGLIAAAITDISGASDVFKQGVITYANDAKITLLGVNKKTIEKHGAVSEAVAREMAEGARQNAGAELAISATGIAGPSGGTPEKPVGLVFIACATGAETKVQKHLFIGDRKTIREQAVGAALDLAISLL